MQRKRASERILSGWRTARFHNSQRSAGTSARHSASYCNRQYSGTHVWPSGRIHTASSSLPATPTGLLLEGQSASDPLAHLVKKIGRSLRTRFLHSLMAIGSASHFGQISALQTSRQPLKLPVPLGPSQESAVEYDREKSRYIHSLDQKGPGKTSRIQYCTKETVSVLLTVFVSEGIEIWERGCW